MVRNEQLSRQGRECPSGENVLHHPIVQLCLIALFLGGATCASAAAAEPAPDSRSTAYADAWGPATGTRLPLLEAPDQQGRMRTLDDLAGDRGLLLFLIRSADW